MGAGSFAELSMFMKDQQVLLLEEQKGQRQQLQEQMQDQRQLMQDQRQQMQEQRQQIEELKAPQEAISAQQVEALTARLQALHAAQMLSDDELFAVEDCVADFVEARAACEVVTLEIVAANRAVGKAHKLVALSEAMPGDGMFARQLRRKFV